MQIIRGGLRFINILICYHSATRHETCETNLKNVPTLDFSLHLFDSLLELSCNFLCVAGDRCVPCVHNGAAEDSAGDAAGRLRTDQ